MTHTNESVRVLIADDHPSFRMGVREVLQDDGFVICAEAESAEEAVDRAMAELPDVCLLDIRMPGGGIEAAESICRVLPRTRVVMLTVSRREDDVMAALRAGAVGFLNKDIDPDVLGEALRATLRGEAALSRQLVGRVIEEFRARGERHLTLPDGRKVELTPREWEVLRFLRDGRSTAEIAGHLFVSPGTVRSHVSSLLGKLGAPDRDALRVMLHESPQRSNGAEHTA